VIGLQYLIPPDFSDASVSTANQAAIGTMILTPSSCLTLTFPPLPLFSLTKSPSSQKIVIGGMIIFSFLLTKFPSFTRALRCHLCCRVSIELATPSSPGSPPPPPFLLGDFLIKLTSTIRALDFFDPFFQRISPRSRACAPQPAVPKNPSSSCFALFYLKNFTSSSLLG